MTGNKIGETGERQKKIRKRKKHVETRAQIEVVAFSKTVYQVLTGDQIGRLVLSARKTGASGLCFLFVDVGVSFFFFVFLLLFAVSLFRLSVVDLVTGRSAASVLFEPSRGRKTRDRGFL